MSEFKISEIVMLIGLGLQIIIVIIAIIAGIFAGFKLFSFIGNIIGTIRTQIENIIEDIKELIQSHKDLDNKITEKVGIVYNRVNKNSEDIASIKTVIKNHNYPVKS